MCREVEATRLELVTSSMPWKRSTKTELRPRRAANSGESGGGVGLSADRTGLGRGVNPVQMGRRARRPPLPAHSWPSPFGHPDDLASATRTEGVPARWPPARWVYAVG